MAKHRSTGSPRERLFAEDQKHLFEKSYEERLHEEKSRPVECLGMTFPNDEERRKHFLEKLREKLKDPEFRKIEGFPIGSDEDILCLAGRSILRLLVLECASPCCASSASGLRTSSIP